MLYACIHLNLYNLLILLLQRQDLNLAAMTFILVYNYYNNYDTQHTYLEIDINFTVEHEVVQ